MIDLYIKDNMKSNGLNEKEYEKNRWDNGDKEIYEFFDMRNLYDIRKIPETTTIRNIRQLSSGNLCSDECARYNISLTAMIIVSTFIFVGLCRNERARR